MRGGEAGLPSTWIVGQVDPGPRSPAVVKAGGPITREERDLPANDATQPLGGTARLRRCTRFYAPAGAIRSGEGIQRSRRQGDLRTASDFLAAALTDNSASLPLASATESSMVVRLTCLKWLSPFVSKQSGMCTLSARPLIRLLDALLSVT